MRTKKTIRKLSSWFVLATVVLSALLIPAAPAAAGVTEEWVARYNGPSNSGDGASAMAVDASGNIYVTGYSYGSFTSTDYATVKYDPNGNQLWVARYNEPGYYTDAARAIAVDKDGNVYVTGYSYGSGTSADYATIKYDPNGNELWVARYNGPGNSQDIAAAIALDASGNVYVTGWSYVSDTDSDYATIKYDPNGNQLWIARYNGPGNRYDAAYNIALDASGNVYVTGDSYGSGTSTDYATIKYDPNGNQLWIARYNGLGNRYDAAYNIALDASGNVYVTGWSYGSGTSRDYATIKYDPNGNQLWVARYNGPGNSADYANAIAVDASGNVYVTGNSRSSTTFESADYATIKYDSNGNQLWVARYAGGAGRGANSLALDGSGNVYVTGESAGSGTSNDYATIKYKEVPDDFVALAAGNLHSCALRAVGSVQCWGDNGYGQLGNGGSADSSTPVQVGGIDSATALAVGHYHSCARLAEGSVQCWGRNSAGQLGNGSTALGVRTPVTVSGINTATAVATGGSHSCALLTGGSVQCWGDNNFGQLGDGSTNDSLYPVSVVGINTAIALGAGTAHTCALLADRSIRCWGYNGSGRLGNGNAVNSPLPVPVSNISSATAIAVGHLHSCARLADSSVRCWGNNGSGRLGNGNTVRAPTPVRVRNLSTATAITAGGAHTCARLSNGSEQCWGDNTYGQLGNGSSTDAHTPVPVTGLTTVTAITTGSFHSCAALTDGSAHCWGRNNAGQLGNGNLVNSPIPVPVSGINVASAANLAGEP